MAIDWEFYSGDQCDYEAFVLSHKNQEVIYWQGHSSSKNIGLRNPSYFPILPRLFFFFFFEEMICFYLNKHRSGGVKLNWTTIYTPNSCSSS